MIRATLLVFVLSTSPIAAEPRAFTTVAVLQDDEALNGAHDVELQGDYAYVPGKGGSLAIIHIADPAKPRIVWSKRDPELFTDAETVAPAGEVLFLGSRDFLTLDIRNPSQPRVMHTTADRSRIDRINGFVGRNSLWFAANKEGWIDVFEMFPVPKLCAARNVAELDGVGKPHDVDFCGEHLIVVDPAGFGRRNVPGQVGFYRVFGDRKLSEPDHNRKLLEPEQWTLVGKASDERLVGGNRVRGYTSKEHGDFAIVAASISPDAIDKEKRQPCVAVVDATDVAKPVVVGVVPFPDVRGPNGLDVVGHVAFAAGGQTVMAVDLSDPRKPKLLAAEKCNDVFHGEPGLDDGHDLEYRAGYLYVTGQTSHTFGVLRIADSRIRGLAEAEKRP
jgi:hypothetical protein